MQDKHINNGETPPKRLHAPTKDFLKNRSKIPIFDRLYYPDLVNFNRSDEHCRECVGKLGISFKEKR